MKHPQLGDMSQNRRELERKRKIVGGPSYAYGPAQIL